MIRRLAEWGRRGLPLVLLAGLSLGTSGCLLATAGALGGAVTYAYCKGKQSQLYPADFADTWAAVEAALGDFGMPVLKVERQATKGKIESRTADGEKVKIQLETIPSPIPADGTVTRVAIRVATFGDQFVSARFFEQVGAHLTPRSALLPVPVTAAAPTTPAEPPTAEKEQ